jgi:hypothetical protein
VNEVQLLSHVKDGKRLPIDVEWDRDLVELMERCWHQDPAARPTAAEVVDLLTQQVRTTP